MIRRGCDYLFVLGAARNGFDCISGAQHAHPYRGEANHESKI